MADLARWELRFDDHGIPPEQAELFKRELGLLSLSLEDWVENWLRRRDHPENFQLLLEGEQP